MVTYTYGYIHFLQCENAKRICTEKLTCPCNKSIKRKRGQWRADDSQYVGCFDTQEEL